MRNKKGREIVEARSAGHWIASGRLVNRANHAGDSKIVTDVPSVVKSAMNSLANPCKMSQDYTQRNDSSSRSCGAAARARVPPRCAANQHQTPSSLPPKIARELLSRLLHGMKPKAVIYILLGGQVSLPPATPATSTTLAEGGSGTA
jgi:hypothetical protein